MIALILRTSVVLLAALLGAHACRRRSAAMRHFVLAMGVAAALATIPVMRFMPAWEIAAPDPAPAVAAVAVHEPGTVANRRDDLLVRATATRASWMPRVTPMAWVLWIGGVVVMGAQLLAGLIGLHRISRRAAPLADARWMRVRDDVASRLGVARPVPLQTADVPPGTWGWWRPRVVLPADASSWPDGRAFAVLAHELAHVRRGDWIVQLAAELLRAALWFNPLAWLVAGRLREEGERACDDAVLEAGVRDHEYAAHLLDLARAGRGPQLAAAMSVARPSTLEGRVAAMLNPMLDRRVPSRPVRLAVGAAAILLACAAAARVTAQVPGPAPLQGVVYDSSGAVLPAVEMALTNEQGIKWAAPTDGEGKFEFAPVGAGKYVLEASLPGLSTLHQEIVLERPKDWTRILTMQVGELQETIQVTARRPRTPAAPSAASGPVRVGGNIKAPRKIAHVNPIYPESMRAAGLEGVVTLDVLIATDGTVASVRVLNSAAHPDFATAATDAVRQWKFTPTLLNNAPVEVAMTVSLYFSLAD